MVFKNFPPTMKRGLERYLQLLFRFQPLPSTLLKTCRQSNEVRTVKIDLPRENRVLEGNGKSKE